MQRQNHQQQLIKLEELEDEHSIFNQMRMMMDAVTRDRTISTDLTNQVTLERTVISDLANKIK